MIRIEYLTDKIDDFLLEEDKKNKEAHIPSGKLSASMLWQPLQWQVLKVKGIKGKDIDSQGYRNMYRGKMIEREVIEKFLLNDLIDEQVEVEYRDTVGYVDAILETEKM